MQNDSLQGILFDKSATVNLETISASQRRKLLLRNLMDKYSVQYWRRKNAKQALPPSKYTVIHSGRQQAAELSDLVSRFKTRV